MQILVLVPTPKRNIRAQPFSQGFFVSLNRLIIIFNTLTLSGLLVATPLILNMLVSNDAFGEFLVLVLSTSIRDSALSEVIPDL